MTSNARAAPEPPSTPGQVAEFPSLWRGRAHQLTRSVPETRWIAAAARAIRVKVALELEATFAAHRPLLLRHAYRMLGSFAEAEDVVQDTFERAWKARSSYRGDAPVVRWLLTITTNACLNVIARRRRVRLLPQLETEPGGGEFPTMRDEPDAYVTPAPDARLFADPAEISESRESVALAFVALLQRVPPRQRAVLLMKDVLGWSADDIAGALGLTLASVNSALHRGREAIARPDTARDEPSTATVTSFVRAWETRDLDGLVSLLRDDITLAMPPYAMWFRGRDAVVRFLRTPQFSSFWAAGVRVIPTRANGLPAFAFYRDAAGAPVAAHSLMVARFVGERAAELTVFLGANHVAPFDFSFTGDRTVSTSSMVMENGGTDP